MRNQILNQMISIECSCGCKTKFYYSSIKRFVSPAEYEKHMKNNDMEFSDGAPAISICPTANCPETYLRDQNPNYECKNCKISYCTSCKVEIHVGKTCEVFRQEKQLQGVVIVPTVDQAQLQAKQCTQCKVWTTKSPHDYTLVCQTPTCNNRATCFHCGGLAPRCPCGKTK